MQEPVFRPIGIVRNEVKEPKRGGWEEVASEVVIEEGLEECLEGLEEFSHILVVFWMHKVPAMRQPVCKIHPQGRADLPLVGLFATRSPYRPNPVGVSAPRLVERKGNVLRVVGLDAIDGTPVLDIKPYLPHLDALADYRGPDWVSKFRR
jgi:tRNA-Thr(GGU) m(6)t(6)A37 methyltransferase TsaA